MTEPTETAATGAESERVPLIGKRGGSSQGPFRTNMCLEKGLHFLPLSVAILLPLTFITSYGIAVALGHVEPGFPYISDTGTMSPESCVFGQLLNICAVLTGATIYIRCRQVEEHNRNGSSRLLLWNKVSLYLGLLAALGLSMVGNFQETNVIVVHLIGALLAFGLGLVYCWVQAVMSYYMHPHLNSLIMAHIRLALSIFTTIFFFLTFISASVAGKAFKGKDPKKWNPDDGGFVEHVVSTASEWAMSAGILGYFLTFIGEFRRISMSTPEVRLIISRENVIRGESDSSNDLLS